MAASKPVIGPMRQFAEYGKMASTFNKETGGLDRVFKKEGEFWARRMGVGVQEGSDLVQSLDGVDTSDDITKLRTWAGHPVSSQYYVRMNDQIYSVVSASPSGDGRTVDYMVVAGLRDLQG